LGINDCYRRTDYVIDYSYNTVCSGLCSLNPRLGSVVTMGGATGGCGGTMSLHLWDQMGTGGGPMLLQQQTVFIRRESVISATLSLKKVNEPSMRPSIISKHILLDVNGLKSDWALYKIWHIAAKLCHETNLAITKLSLSLIHNTIGLGLPMFINVTTRQQISIYSTGPY